MAEDNLIDDEETIIENSENSENDSEIENSDTIDDYLNNEYI